MSKNKYLLIIAILLSLSITSPVMASLSGSYNVGVGQTFTTITDALKSWKDSTITGNVIFMLMDANYPSETFPLVCTIPAAYSGGNWNLTIKPVSQCSIIGNNSTALWNVKSINRLTIDGSASDMTKDLVIYNSSTASGPSTIRLINGASYNTIKNCIIKGQGLFGHALSIYTSASGSASGNCENLIENCDITRGQDTILYNTVYVYSSSSSYQNMNNTIQHCNIYNFYMAGVTVGSYSPNTIITECNFYSTFPQLSSYMYGIYTFGNCEGMIATRNRIGGFLATYPSGISTQLGMYLTATPTTGTHTIANNFIYLDAYDSPDNNNIYGIGVGGPVNTNYNIYYNSIYISGTAVYGLSAGIARNRANLDIKNNIVFNNRTGGSGATFCIFDSTGVAGVTSNYNDFYCPTPGSNSQYVGYQNGTIFNALSNWQSATGFDLNSISLNPDFVSATDLHISPSSSNVNNLGTPIPGITNDFDGDIRNLITPDIGADEYTPTGVITYTITAAASSGGSITPSGVVVVNSGEDTTFTITPDIGHHLDSLIVDGINHGPDSTSYKFENVIAEHTIDAYFSTFLGEPFLRVGDWFNPEPWHNWIGGIDDTSQVQMTGFDPDTLIQYVDFYYSTDGGYQWDFLYRDNDGTGPWINSTFPTNWGDGWAAYLPHNILPQIDVPVDFKAIAHTMTDSVVTQAQRIYDPTPPSACSLNICDWDTIETPTLELIITPIGGTNIANITVYVAPKKDTFNKGIPPIHQQGNTCTPTAAAACLKWFESQGDSGICAGLDSQALAESLGRRMATKPDSGTRAENIVSGIAGWTLAHGNGYVSETKPHYKFTTPEILSQNKAFPKLGVVKSITYDVVYDQKSSFTTPAPRAIEYTWKKKDFDYMRKEIERGQNVLLTIHRPDCKAHTLTLSSIVNTPLPNGDIRVDFMDPATGEIEWGDLNPATGKLSNYTGPFGDGNVVQTDIVCPREANPGGDGPGVPQGVSSGRGTNPDTIQINFPHPGHWFVHIIIIDQSGHSHRFIIIVYNSSTPVWAQQESIVTPQVNKIIKDGGALVGVPGSDKDASKLYAFLGTKTNKVRIYTVGTGWSDGDSLIFGHKYNAATYTVDTDKFAKKYPGKGAALCYDGTSKIYATKGNGTNEFFVYDLTTDVGWTAKAYVPTPKGLKGGTSIQWFDGKVYLLAGGQKKDNPNNFYSYDPTQDTIGGAPWTALGGIPLGPDTKVFKDGSSIVELGGTFYAIHGGAKTNLFYAYDWGTNEWLTKDEMPIDDSSYHKYKKKLLVKDGAISASGNGVIYATKGGGTEVFWKYTPIADVGWERLERMPIEKENKKHAPKTGAAMAFVDGRIYLLVGNKQVDFWCYVPEVKSKVKTQMSKVTQNVNVQSLIPNLQPQINVTPNPFTKLTTIRYTVPISGKVSLRLYNAAGRLIETLNDGYLNTGNYTTTLSNITKGVYFLKYESNTNKSEIKLIVQ